MLPREQLERVAVVLVRARNPNNIGAVARAMHDFGFRDLRVVNEYTVPLEGARSAVDASAIIAAAREFRTVAAAIEACSLVIGTTAVGERDLTHRLYELPQAGPLIRAALAAPEGRVALLFGSEKTGLSNEELSHCNWLMTIPMHRGAGERHVSMNLGQAAAVCLFEIVREGSTAPSGGSQMASQQAGSFQAGSSQATGGDLERLSTLLEAVLEQSDYMRRHPANSDLAQIRRLTRRMGLEPGDAAVWTGILRQVLWKLSRRRADGEEPGC